GSPCARDWKNGNGASAQGRNEPNDPRHKAVGFATFRVDARGSSPGVSHSFLHTYWPSLGMPGACPLETPVRFYTPTGLPLGCQGLVPWSLPFVSSHLLAFPWAPSGLCPGGSRPFLRPHFPYLVTPGACARAT